MARPRYAMYRWFLAYKYSFRLITLAALLGVAFSVTVLIVVVSVMEGFRSELAARIRGTTSDIRVESSVFVGLERPERVASIVEEVPGVMSTSPVVETLALYRRLWPYPSEDATDRLLIALDPEEPATARELDSYIRAVEPPGEPVSPGIRELIDSLPDTAAGVFSPDWIHQGLPAALRKFSPFLESLPAAGEDVMPAIVGSETLRQERLLPGALFELTSFSPVPPHGPCTRTFRVAGYFKTGLYELDAKGIILRLNDADEFLGLRGPDGHLRVSALRVSVDDARASEEDLRAVRSTIEARLAERDVLFVEAQTWREAKHALLRAVSMEKLIVSIILGVVILFAGFMIFIILTVQVVERSRDIGVLVSLGATARGIATSYFLIGFGLCLAGTLLGTVYGVGFALGINTIQRWVKLLTGLELFPQDVYYLDHIPVRFQPSDLLFIIVPTVCASLVASLVPALRAARKDPVVSLRYK